MNSKEENGRKSTSHLCDDSIFNSDDWFSCLDTSFTLFDFVYQSIAQLSPRHVNLKNVS